MKSISSLKFRNMYGDKPHKTFFEGINLHQQPIEGSGMKGNHKWIGFPWQSNGGGILCVNRIDNPKKVTSEQPKIIGHKGNVVDFDFCPFDEGKKSKLDIVATGAEDGLVRVWRLPEQLTENLMEPLITLSGHLKKITLVAFNPVAQNILASVSYDGMIKIWDLTKAECIKQIDMSQAGNCYTLAWNYNGSLLGTTWKDQQVRIIDPREETVVKTCQGHLGHRSQKFTWMGKMDRFITTGFHEDGRREVIMHNLSTMEVVSKKIVDSGAQPLFGLFDEGLQLLFLIGKGDSNVRFFELLNDELHYVNEYRDGHTCKAFYFMPKYMVDVNRVEIQKLAKINQTHIEFVSMIQPRKGEAFQADLFPDCPSRNPALQAPEWIEGKNAECILQSMDPAVTNPEKQQKKTDLKKIEQVKQEEHPKVEQIKRRISENHVFAEYEEKIRKLEADNLAKDETIKKLQEEIQKLSV